jgi:23S rRNA pseudouridine1911/1915/1917 synthase
LATQEPDRDDSRVDLLVTAELDGARVDKAVAGLLGVSRAEAAELVGRGVTVDGVPARASERVSEGALLNVSERRPDIEVEPEEVDFEVLYQDDDVIVVDKPADLVVHPGAGRRTGTLSAGLLYRFPELESVGEPGRWGLVHRLDKDTSGVLLVARTVEAMEVLRRRMKAREIRRTYTTLAHGAFEAPTGTIDAPIGRDSSRPMFRAVTPTGKPARTHYSVVNRYPGEDCTLLEVKLETGRTHQIRVHLAAIGHPVVGDPVYGLRQKRSPHSPRIFLHAAEIMFDHPRTGLPTTVSSSLPADLAGVLDGMTPE